EIRDEVHQAGPDESARTNAHHRKRPTVDEQLAAYHTRVAGEPLLPIVVAEHSDRMRPWDNVVFGGEQAPCSRPEAKPMEVISRHRLAPNQLRLTTGFLDAQSDAVVAVDRLERCALALVILIIGIGEAFRVIRGSPRGVERHQPIGILHGKLLENVRVNKRENRRARSYAQRQREHDYRREAGTSAQHPESVTQVLPQSVHASTSS